MIIQIPYGLAENDGIHRLQNGSCLTFGNSFLSIYQDCMRFRSVSTASDGYFSCYTIVVTYFDFISLYVYHFAGQ